MKNPLKKNKFLALIFALALIIVLANIFQKQVRNFFYWFSFPAQERLWAAGNKTSDFFEGILKISTLKEELDILKQERQGFIVKLNQIEKLKEENKELKQALNINNLENSLDLSFASIISKSFSEDEIFINKGSENGLSKGMPVLTGQKALVGKLNQVYKNYSSVSLVSKKGFSFDVKIKGDKDVSAIAEGEGGLNISLNLIPREENIQKESAVFTSSLGGNFPDSLLVGKIKEIVKKDAESFQKARIENAFNLEELNHLFIITNFNHD